jgi:hypothetical protein
VLGGLPCCTAPAQGLNSSLSIAIEVIAAAAVIEELEVQRPGTRLLARTALGSLYQLTSVETACLAQHCWQFWTFTACLLAGCCPFATTCVIICATSKGYGFDLLFVLFIQQMSVSVWSVAVTIVGLKITRGVLVLPCGLMHACFCELS